MVQIAFLIQLFGLPKIELRFSIDRYVIIKKV